MKEKIKIPKGQFIQESLYNSKGELIQIITSDELRRNWFLYDVEGSTITKVETGSSPKFKKRKI